MSDLELLQDYARAQSQAAFTALVDRYVNLVYSAALRQVRSPQLAEEISQSVFLELSRRAAHFPPGQPVAAWLYVVTRRTALNVLRHEARRLARETTAAEIAAMKTPPESWSKVEARLDEAMDTLSEIERSAIVLRFFENQSLRDVGAALGLSEDSAQKRVSRALDRLRAFFASRGVAVGAATLAADLSAHAVQTAPLALGATIATGTSALSTTAIAAGKTIVMTTLQKTMLAASLALVTGAGLYEANLFGRQQADLATLGREAVAFSARLDRTREAQSAASLRLKTVEAHIDLRLAARASLDPADAALEGRMKTWLASLDALKDALKQRPQLGIPELALLSDESWFNVASANPLDSDDNIRRAFASLRHSAENTMASKISQALSEYVKTSGGLLPNNVDQLVSFFSPPIDPALLSRYEMLKTGRTSDLTAAEKMAIIAAKSPADVELDAYWRIGFGFSNSSALSYNISQARRAFTETHNGARSNDAGELQPYLKWPVDDVVLRKFLTPAPSRNSP